MEANSFFGQKVAGSPKSKYVGPAILLGLILMPQLADAQCAMCRAVLESEGSTDIAKGINNGIVYLMAVPYLLVAGVFFAVYRIMKQRAKNNTDARD